MEIISRLERPSPPALERFSTRVAFFIAGFGMAAWAPLVPFAKQRLDLGAGTLGLLLLCIGAGSIATAPFAGSITVRFGCRRVIWAACLIICACLPALAVAASAPALAAVLLLFGGGLALLDVAMNIQAVMVEQAAGSALMSGFHGLFSVGGIAGAAGASALLWLGATPLIATLCIVFGILALLLASGRHLLPYGNTGEAPVFVWPHGLVLVIGLLCFIMFLTEGSMLDWSAVFLTNLRGVAASHGGFGYAVFAVAMSIGRLNGDRIVRRFGSRVILVAGPLCAAAGLALAVFVPVGIAAFAGFLIVGIGASNVVPVMFSAAGNQAIMPPNLAISSITTIGYTGVLAGPAAIGFIAHATSLPDAFLCVAGMLLVVAATARFIS